MTNAMEIGFLLFFLLFPVHSKEAKTPEPIFRQQGGAIEMGYCFGADYISVYRSRPDGDQLLGSSSNEEGPPSPPKDYQGRVNITSKPPLLGLQINHLRHSDSGLYRRECWKDKTRVDQHESELSVCEVEVTSQELSITEDGGAVLLCNSALTGREGVTIQWYHEVFPQYKAIKFLDSSVSPEPLQEELKALVDAREGGASVRVAASMLKSSHHFYCLVMEGERCLSFHNTYLPEPDEVSLYVAEGERVVLPCNSEHQGKGQRWDTPLGQVNTTRKSQHEGDDRGDKMYMDDSGGSGKYSLVIPEASNTSSGLYSCFSPSLVAEFSLVVCPTQEPLRKLFFENGEAVLECEATQEEDNSVLWYHRKAPGQNQLILDSKDRTVALPEYLRGRANFSNSVSMRLTELSGKDAGEYFCVVLKNQSPDYEDYPGGDDDENADEEDYEYTDDYGKPWQDEPDRCISKQETNLQMAPDDPDVRPRTPESSPEPPTNTALYAGCAVGGLALLVGAVVGAVLSKKRRTTTEDNKNTPEQGKMLSYKTDA